MITQYAAITFRFPGKAECRAWSADFVIESETRPTDREISEQAKVAAHDMLATFFSEVFPDAAVAAMTEVEIVSITPGVVMFYPDGEAVAA